MKLLWLLALMPALVSANSFTARNGPDSVYIYSDSGNQQYHCTAYLAYFDTDGGSVYFADRCQPSSRDTGTWPLFTPQPIYVSMDFLNRNITPIRQDCRMVAYAMNPDRTTSSVIDCRGQANAAATAR